MPRFRRMLLLVAGLALLALPQAPQASATHVTFEAQVDGMTTNPALDPIIHSRETGRFDSARLVIESSRVSPDARQLAGTVATTPGVGIGFTARQTLGEGRGFITPNATAARGTGTVVHPPGTGTQTVHVEVEIASGVFHRVGTVADVELTVHVRALNRGGAEVWEHRFCIRGQLTAVPVSATQSAITGQVRADETHLCIPPVRVEEDAVHG